MPLKKKVDATAKTNATQNTAKTETTQVEAETTQAETTQVETTGNTQVEAEKGVAVVNNTNNTVATQPNMATRVQSNFTQEQAEQGLLGLELTAGSYPVIVLKGADFHCDDFDVDKEFTLQVFGTTPTWMCYKEGEEDGDTAYSDDEINLTPAHVTEQSRTIEELRQEWLEDGDILMVKKFLYITGEVLTEDSDMTGETVSLRVPPMSQRRLGGMADTLARKGLFLTSKQVALHVSVGPQKSAKNNKSYYPWKFKIVENPNQQDVA